MLVVKSLKGYEMENLDSTVLLTVACWFGFSFAVAMIGAKLHKDD